MITIPEKTLAYRNNNPGNLRFAGQRGAAQGEGGFARFETPEEGWNAMVAQVDLDSRRGHTVESFIHKYAPPVENDTNHYLDFVTKEAGVEKNAKLDEIDRVKLAKALAKLESGTTISDEERMDMMKEILTEEPSPEVTNVQRMAEEVPMDLGQMKQIEEDSTKPQLNQMSETPVEVTMENLETLLADGHITEDQAMEFMTREELKGHFLDMTPEGVEDALNRGLLTEDQADAWCDYQESPFWFYAGDIAKAPLKGIEKAAEEIMQTAFELFGVDKIAAAVNKDAPKFEIPDIISDTHSTPGQIVSTLSQFFAPYAGASKLVTAASVVPKVMSTTKMLQIAAAYPKLVKPLEVLIHGTVAGAMADFTAFDPLDPKLVDWAEETGFLPEFLDFMLTDPTDPAPYNRLRGVLEGAITGVALDTLLLGFKGAKQYLTSKYMGDIDGAIEDVIQKNDKVRKGYNEIRDKEAGVTTTTTTTTPTSTTTTTITTPAAQAPPKLMEPSKYTLPQDLKGMKPRYGYGQKLFEVEFSNDFDKATYTLVQNKKGKSHDGLLADMMKTTGLSEAELVAHGKKVKDALKAQAKGAETGGKLKVTGIEPPVKAPTVEHVKPDPGEKPTAGPNDPGAKPEAEAKPAPEAGPRTLNTEKVPDEAVDLDEMGREIRIFEDIADGKIGLADKLTEKVKALGGNVERIWAIMGKHSEDLVDDASGGPLKSRGTYSVRVSDAAVELGAEKILKDEVTKTAALYGASESATRQALVNMAKDTFQNMYQVTKRVRAMNMFVEGYIKDVERLIDAGMGTFAKKLEVLEHIKITNELRAMVYGVRSETGRLQRSWRKGGRGWDLGDALEGVDDVAPGAKPKPDGAKPENRFNPENRIDDPNPKTEKEIDAIIDAWRKSRTTKDKMKIARNMGNTRFLRSVLEYVQLNLLYGPHTQAFNFVSQLATTVWKAAHRSIGAGAQTLVTGDRRALEEVGAYFHGLGEGLANGFRMRRRTTNISLGEHIMKNPEVGAVWKSLWEGKGQIDPMQTKFDGGDNTYLEAAFQALPGFMQPLGKLIRWPFHALSAVDEGFKQALFHAELLSTVSREARNRFLQGADADAFVKRNMANPPAFVYEEAMRSAREGTFQDTLDKFSGGVDKLLNSGNVGLMVKIAAVPFYKVQVNVLKWAARNSAFAPFSRRWKEEFAMGGVRRYEAISRMITGSAVMGLAWSKYEKGEITGRCPKELRPLWEQTKRQEYSYKNSKGEWVSYERMEPFRTLIGVAANAFMLKDYYDLYEGGEIEGEELFWATMASFTDIITSNTWVASIQDLVNLMSGDTRMDPKKLALKQAEKFVPGSMGANFAQNTFNDDKLIRELKTFDDLMWKKAGTHNMTPKRHALYGTTMVKDPKVWGMFQTKVPSEDPVAIEMGNIKCVIPSLLDHFSKDEIPLELTNDQYQKLQDIIAGMPVQEMLERTINHPKYQQLQSPDKRSKILKGQVADIRNSAKKILLGTDRELFEQYKQKNEEHVEDLLGYHADTDPSGALYKWRKLMR